MIRKNPPTIEKRSKVWVPLITLSFEPELVERDEPAPHFLTFEPKPQLEMEFKNLNNSVTSYVTVRSREGPPMIVSPPYLSLDPSFH
ncbi:hypothetical protein OIU78_014753 [Salix suchowensis]|nr:hypothetical protein OIU78_014753 [Salix suchowensis]